MLKTDILLTHWKTLQEQHFHCETGLERAKGQMMIAWFRFMDLI